VSENQEKQEVEGFLTRYPADILEKARTKSKRTGISIAFVLNKALEEWVESEFESLSKRDVIRLRISVLRELRDVFRHDPEASSNIRKSLRMAEADEIALTDPEAADRYRRLDPEF